MAVSQTLNEQLSAANQSLKARLLPKSRTEEPKVHRGPFNANAVTLKDPRTVMADLIAVLGCLGVHARKENNFSMKCRHKNVKFLIEVNSLEPFPNIHIVKFFRTSYENENYMGLCSEIFKKLNL